MNETYLSGIGIDICSCKSQIPSISAIKSIIYFTLFFNCKSAFDLD